MSELFGTVPGTVLNEGRVQNGASFVEVMKGVGSGEALVRLEGLVVSICGGGSLPQADPICFDVGQFSTAIASKGGILVHGGQNEGTSLAAANAEPDTTLGVSCLYYELIPYGARAIVNSYQTRKMILTLMPHVTVFPGKVGTLDELMTCIGWIKSLKQQHAEPPHLWVHTYWWDVLELLKQKQAIQDFVWEHIHPFTDSSEIISNPIFNG